MRLKIFSCHHLVPDFTCNTEVFQTLVSNIPAPGDGAFMSDLGSINIAADNLYSELRHQYFVWKNLLSGYDHVGFEHYRRPFFIDPLPARRLAAEFPELWETRLFFAAIHKAGLRRTQDIFEQYLAMRRTLDPETIAHLKEWIGGFDVVVPRPNFENIERQWKSCFDDDIYWNVMVEGVRRSRYFTNRPNLVFFQIEICYFANMYIMRSELLDEYLTFCFEVLDWCRSRLDLRERALGYFSERLFSFWLYQKRIEQPTLRVLELPFIMPRKLFGREIPYLAARPVV